LALGAGGVFFAALALETKPDFDSSAPEGDTVRNRRGNHPTEAMEGKEIDWDRILAGSGLRTRIPGIRLLGEGC
jgi:hypothetical protein